MFVVFFWYLQWRRHLKIDGESNGTVGTVTNGTVRFFMNFQMTAPLQVAKENSELYNRHCRSKKRYMDKWLNGTEGARADKIYTGERKKKLGCRMRFSRVEAIN